MTLRQEFQNYFLYNLQIMDALGWKKISIFHKASATLSSFVKKQFCPNCNIRLSREKYLLLFLMQLNLMKWKL